MTEPFYVARASVEKIDGVHRRAHLEAGAAVDMGVHGAVKAHYRLDDAPDLPLPVDYVVAATGTWMLGTLNGALEVRGVKMARDAITARVEGVNEVRGKLPVLTAIRIHYTLRIPSGSRALVDRALATHQEKCPTAASLSGAIDVSWTADIEETLPA